MTTNDPVIEFDDVEFSYIADTPVLRGVDLTLGRGEFVTIIGQNGSGKTTLAKHMNSLLEPDQGSVRIHSREGAVYDTRQHTMRTLARLVGYVFQNPDDQIFHTKIYDEIAYGLKNVDTERSEWDDRITDVLDAVDLEGRLFDNPFSLGVGERQRLALAGVLVMEPDVICVDEPTTGQDRTEGRKIMEILKEYNRRGHTVVAITHDMALAAEYTDRLIVVKDGQIIEDGPPEQVFLRERNLEQTNIRPPQIMQLGITLKDRAPTDVLTNMWLTVDHAYDDLSAALGAQQASAPSPDESDDEEW